jgi:ABC-type polysaccharide/polyol phosphate export permease
MNWNNGIRQTHRWLSIAFTVVVVIVTLLAVRPEQPAEWVYYLPLPPLFLLLFTGLYLFVLPYAAKWRGKRNVG